MTAFLVGLAVGVPVGAVVGVFTLALLKANE